MFHRPVPDLQGKIHCVLLESHKDRRALEGKAWNFIRGVPSTHREDLLRHFTACLRF